MTAPPSPLTTALADRYRLERELGRGGMATVYLARDVRHDRDVAIKVLRPDLSAIVGPDRFLREIRITAKLEHPHILALIDSGETAGYLWYVLPYVPGESLRQKVSRQGPLPIDEAVAITHQVASALDYAHRQGVVHRDIKLENILLFEGAARLMDFGIALAVQEAGTERLTETGFSIGTPAYMSPEQASGTQPVDGRSDIYSLACVLYEMLAGDPPFTGTNVQALLARKQLEAPRPLRTVRPTVPIAVERAVARALRTTPADRFETAGQFAVALQHERVDRIEAAGLYGRLPRARKWIIAAAVLAVAAAVLTAVTWLGSRDPAAAFDRMKGSRVIIEFPLTPQREFMEAFNLRFGDEDQVRHRGEVTVLPDPADAQVTLPNARIEVHGRPVMVDLEHDVVHGRVIVILPGLPPDARSDSLGRFAFEVSGLSVSIQVPVFTRRVGDSLIVRVLERGTPSSR